jgi:hypothetical protein
VKKLAWLGLIALVPVILTACVPYTSRSYQPTYPNPSGGMMGPGTTGPGTTGPGMMGPGMMGGTVGGWGGYDPEARQISIDEAATAVNRYLSAYYGENLVLVEVMEFAWNFYAEVEEEDTGIHAMELLVDKYSGQVFPEMGPNMMWNTKYGMMTGYAGRTEATADMPITVAEAEELAQQILSANLADFTVGEAETFYGYYTMHTLKNGEIEGMLSVNGYSGAVWYHNWHGSFIQMEEFND